MKGNNILGKWSSAAAAVTLVGCVVASIASHLFGRNDPFLDMLGVASFGILAGTSGAMTQLNGTVKRTVEQDQELAQLRALVTQLLERSK